MIDSGPHSRPHAAMSKTLSGAAFRQNAGRRAIHPHSGEVRLRYMTVCLMLASMVMVCCGVSVAPAAEPPAPDFQNDVLPLLKNRCVKCHGPAKQEGKLNLSLPPGIARGGETGAVIVPGNVQDSLLWQLVETDEMPKDSPLSVEEKDLLRRWIAGGAVGLPAAVAATSGGAEHWAFQKLAPSAPPPVRDRTRLRTPIDAFVQSRLEAKGLSLGPEAGRETLIRRVSLDLTGLPPTPAEIDQYLSDMGYNAYENMIERYLASPCYGERWGKHWLDAAGYADSNGYFNADSDRPLAYRYRDGERKGPSIFWTKSAGPTTVPSLVRGERLVMDGTGNSTVGERGGSWLGHRGCLCWMRKSVVFTTASIAASGAPSCAGRIRSAGSRSSIGGNGFASGWNSWPASSALTCWATQ